MADVKWIKLSVNMFDNEKLKLIENSRGGDTVIVVWLKLLTLAGKQNNGGIFKLGDKPYTSKMLSKVFGRPASAVQRAVDILSNVGLIDVDGGIISIPSWDIHQNGDKLNAIREYNRAAKQRSREKKKMSLTCQGSQETDIDIEKETEIDKDNKSELYKGGFSPPTLEEVTAYCSSRGGRVDPIRFFTYYSACGWMIGKKPMVNWRAAVQKWETDEVKSDVSYDVGRMNIDLFNN